MLQTTSTPKPGENTWLWLYKMISGPLIIVILIIHFIVNHFIGQNALLSYQDVVNYYQIPIIPIMEIVFLALVVSHALIGLRSILLDMHPSKPALTAIDWLFTIVGAVSIVYGVWLIAAIVSQGS